MERLISLEVSHETHVLRNGECARCPLVLHPLCALSDTVRLNGRNGDVRRKLKRLRI